MNSELREFPWLLPDAQKIVEHQLGQLDKADFPLQRFDSVLLGRVDLAQPLQVNRSNKALFCNSSTGAILSTGCGITEAYLYGTTETAKPIRFALPANEAKSIYISCPIQFRKSVFRGDFETANETLWLSRLNELCQRLHAYGIAYNSDFGNHRP